MLLTDDQDRKTRFVVPDVEYGYFPNAQALPLVIAKHIAELQRVTQFAAAGRVKAL